MYIKFSTLRTPKKIYILRTAQTNELNEAAVT